MSGGGDVAGARAGGARVAELVIATSEAMESLGERLGAVLRRGDLVLLSGELGAGKTTLTRGIGAGMRVRGPVTSPTFVLSRVHPPIGDAEVPLVHVDAYRLGSAAELLDLDLDFEGAAVVVEWGDGLLETVADSWLRIRIERETGAGRGTGAGPEVSEALAGRELGEAFAGRELGEAFANGGGSPEWRASAAESPAGRVIARHSEQEPEQEREQGGVREPDRDLDPGFDFEGDAPRLVRLEGHGPDWAELRGLA